MALASIMSEGQAGAASATPLSSVQPPPSLENAFPALAAEVGHTV